MRPSRCACDPPRDYAVSHSSILRADEMRRAGRLREAAVASVERLNPSVRCMSPDTLRIDALELVEYQRYRGGQSFSRHRPPQPSGMSTSGVSRRLEMDP